MSPWEGGRVGPCVSGAALRLLLAASGSTVPVGADGLGSPLFSKLGALAPLLLVITRFIPVNTVAFPLGSSVSWPVQ